MTQPNIAPRGPSFDPSFIGANAQTMSSREIAELTGKQHKHVIRDIEMMLAQLAEDGPNLDHEQDQGVTTQKDARGYTSEIHLPKDLTINLVAGYRADIRLKIVRRWMELETAPATQVHTTLMTDDEMIARSLLLVQAKVERLADENARQAQQLADAQPKIEGFDRLANSDGMFQPRVAAKLLDWPERKFIARLHGMRWIFKMSSDGTGNWNAHADKLRTGLLAHKSYTFTGADGEERTRHQVFVTPKGLAKLTMLLGPYQPSGTGEPVPETNMPPVPPAGLLLNLEPSQGAAL